MLSSLSHDPRSSSRLAVASSELALDATRLRGLMVGAAVVTALVLWVFWHFLAHQVQWAIRYQADWGHTLVIPLIAGYFIYRRRAELLAVPCRTTWVALIPIVLGVGWYTLCWLGPQAIRHHNLQGAGLTLTLFGLVLLFVGFRAMAFLWFPLLYMCVFGQTVSDKLMSYVTYPLQDMTARGAHVTLNLIGIDTERSGNILTVWNRGEPNTLNIAEACSGMRMLMAFLALGVAMAYTGLNRFWQQATLVLLGIPTAIFVNVLRVVTLGLLSMFDAEFAAGDFHTFIGLLWLVPAFLMYLGMMWILRHLIVEEARPARVPASGGRTP